MSLNAVLKGLCLLAPEGGLKCQDSQCGVLGRGGECGSKLVRSRQDGKEVVSYAAPERPPAALTAFFLHGISAEG